MNSSSGIKRGLAATAVAALAVTGIPALASSANAAVGDNFTVVSTGPALNGGTEGAVVVLRAEDGEITPADLNVTGTSSPTAGSEDTADQTVDIVGVPTVTQDPSSAAYEFVEVRVAVTTTVTGDSASFRLFEDDVNAGILDASEARQTVSISTAGPLASIDIAPASLSTPQNIESGDYNVTLKDAAGRTTQLAPATSITVADEAPVEATGIAADDAIDSDEIATGVESFTADPGAAAVGEYDITLTQGAVTKTATLNVSAAAALTENEINIVTAADDWTTFGSGSDGGTTLVRVDQNTVRFDFDAANSQAGSNVQLSTDGFGGVTFAGQDQAVYTTTLDASGNGSITVTADAATIQEFDGFDVDINGFQQTIEFQRAVADDIDGESAVYFCQLDAACTVTAVVTDQFGNPVTSGEVEASRSGSNNDATPQRKPVGADGTVEFTFTDVNAVNGGTDTVLFEYFVDQFDNTADLSDNSTTIEYSTTGQGSDYVIELDGNDTEAPTYEPADAAVIPLADAVDDGGADSTLIEITGAEANQAVTLSVNNGALILEPGEDSLAEASASVDATTDGGGLLPTNLDGYRIIGTTSGPVTLTVDSASRTETADLVVAAQSNTDTARNVTVSGPATVESGTTQIQFTAVITDAFGNPVPNVPVSALNIQVTGPAVFQDSDAVTNADGQLNLNVRVDSDAEGDVTIRVQGLPTWGQFGAQADREYSNSVADDAEGLPVSADVATATTTVSAPAVVKVDPNLQLSGKSQSGKDKIKANAINKAAGATATLWVNGDKKKTGTLDSSGNFTFSIKDKNGSKKTKYVVKVSGTALTTKASDSIKQK